jgi:hypothetical protein
MALMVVAARLAVPAKAYANDAIWYDNGDGDYYCVNPRPTICVNGNGPPITNWDISK